MSVDSEGAASGGELVAEVLVRQGVRFLPTLCGGHISPILVACKARGIRVVDVRHEATAVFAADAIARLTGRVGVAAVTAGPGVTNTITAVKNAQLAQSPLVLLGGATATALVGRGALQDIDQRALLAPHVKRVERIRRLRDLVPGLRRAFAEAASGLPGPVFVECPVDLLYPREVVEGMYGAKAPPKAGEGLADKALRLYLSWHVRRLFGGAGSVPEGTVQPEPRGVPAGAARRAAALLARSKRPVLVVGSQALLAPGEVDDLAEAVGGLGIPVYLSGMARGLLGPAHPLQLRHRRRQALRAADLVILAGAPCDFRLDYGRHIGRRAALISVNLSRRDLRRNRRPTLGVHGSPAAFLRALATLGPAGNSGEWLESLRGSDAEREEEIRAQAREPVEGVHPLRLCLALDETLGDDSLVVADGGDFVGTASYTVRPRRPLSWLDPGVFGTLGVGAGFALGAALCRPSAEVWLLYGDGSAGYSLIEADTFARLGLGVVAIVGNDASWSQIAREQVEMLGDDVGTVLRSTDYHRAAEGLGASGLLLDETSDIPGLLAQAREIARGGRPVYVNARIARTAFRKGSISL